MAKPNVFFSSPVAEEHLDYWRYQHPTPESYVYIVQALGDSPIKVGTASDIAGRLAGLQTGNPRQLWLLHLLVGGTELECQLHRRLKGDRLMGEWFDGPAVPDFLDFVAVLAEQMLAHHKETGEMPHFRNFGTWERTRHPAPITTRYIEPDPIPPEEAARRLREHEERRYIRPRS